MPVPDGVSMAAWEVANFHAMFDLPMRNTPAQPASIDNQEISLRSSLQWEETRELVEALESDELVAIAKELADVVYVAYGTAITYGINLDEVLRLVHASNMSKLGSDAIPILRDDGKILKGPHYMPAEPAIKRLLENQEELPWDEQ
jgi:predicted HAD superfamily Cof-like phosphohydrolase